MADRVGRDGSYPKGGTFAELLRWHMDVHGTRPGGSIGVAEAKTWSVIGLAEALAARPSDQTTIERRIYEWRSGAQPKGSLLPLERAFFGSNREYDVWRAELRQAARRKPQRDEQTNGALGQDLKRPGTTPIKPARCVGRTAEVADIVGVMRGSDASIVVLGGPGIGKTTLTREISNHPDVIGKFGDRRFFVALENSRSLDEFRIAAAYALPGKEGRSQPIRDLLSQCGTDPILLVLDNLETSWESVPVEIEDELAAAASIAGVSLLASLRGGQAPVSPAWSLNLTLGPLEADAAKDLFRQLAPMIAENDPDLPPVLEELGGVPLAIELVAREVCLFQRIDPILREWRQVGASLAKRNEGGETRLTSLTYSIELTLSSSRRHPRTKSFLSIIAWLPDGIDEELCRSILNDDFFAVYGDVLSSALGFHAGGRIQLLPPISSYIEHAYFVTEIDIRDITDYYVQLLDQLSQLLPEIDDETVDRFLISEQHNLARIVAYAVSRLTLDAIEHFTANVRRCVKAVQATTQLREFYAAGQRLLSISSSVLIYIALRTLMNFETVTCERFYRAGCECLEERLELLLSGVKEAIDELERSVRSPEGLAFISDMRSGLAATEETTADQAGIADDEPSSRKVSVFARSLVKQHQDCLFVRHFEEWYRTGVEEADQAYESWDEAASPEILKDAITRAFGAEHPMSITAAHTLAQAYCHRGSFEAAKQLYLEIEGYVRNTLSIGSPGLRRGFANALDGLGAVTEAREHRQFAEKCEALRNELMPQ